jgi:phosphate acetyltransferase
MSAVPIDAGEGQFHSKYERLVAAAKQVAPAVTMVVHPCDEASLRGVCEAAAAGIIKAVLVGPAGKIKAVAAEFNFDISRFEIVDAAHSEASYVCCGSKPEKLNESKCFPLFTQQRTS